MTMRVGHRQDVNASGTQTRSQCESDKMTMKWDTGKMTMQVGHRQDGNASGTHARCQCEWDTSKMSM